MERRQFVKTGLVAGTTALAAAATGSMAAARFSTSTLAMIPTRKNLVLRLFRSGTSIIR